MILPAKGVDLGDRRLPYWVGFPLSATFGVRTSVDPPTRNTVPSNVAYQHCTISLRRAISGKDEESSGVACDVWSELDKWTWT